MSIPRPRLLIEEAEKVDFTSTLYILFNIHNLDYFLFFTIHITIHKSYLR